MIEGGCVVVLLVTMVISKQLLVELETLLVSFFKIERHLVSRGILQIAFNTSLAY